jgi:hypothetical protein
VFYASIRPVSIEEGYGSVLFDFPWILAYCVLAAAWVGGPVILLVLGLTHLLRHARSCEISSARRMKRILLAEERSARARSLAG